MTQTSAENKPNNFTYPRIVDLPIGRRHAQQRPALLAKIKATTSSSKINPRAPKVETSKRENDQDFFSICPSIDQGQQSFAEQRIVYHYHALKLRHLVVAVDPESVISPSGILETWRKNFGLQVV
jgi:hypothetical protein